MNWLFLILAIVGEVVGTSALKASEGFTKFAPTALSMTAFAITLYLFALALRTIPVGIAYAIWAGLGIIFISVIGIVIFKQSLDAPALIGIAMILGGVVVINLFSSSVSH